MSKSIDVQGQNKVNVVGKLVDVSFRNGKTSDGRDYESANMTVRVKQTYGGREEVSEIPVSMFTCKYTKNGTLNSGWTQFQDMKTFKTVQSVGVDEATTVRLSGANLKENNFVSRTGQLINGWQINASFIGTTVNMADTASFVMDIFIMDMKDEEDRNGDTTGRLEIKGAIVQYGATLDVLNFIVEQPEAVDFIQRNWNVNDTVTVKGRIRVVATEEKPVETSWGEDVPETNVRTTRELVITTGDDCGKEEDFAYSPDDIRKLFQARKARIEQMQIDATSKNKQTTSTSTSSKYSWA